MIGAETEAGSRVMAFVTSGSRRRWAPALPLGLLLLPWPAMGQDLDVDALSPAAVQVRVADGTGSGTLLVHDGRALVFTNRHVVEGFDDVTIAVLLDVDDMAVPRFEARLLAYAADHDFAVYELTRTVEGDVVSVAGLGRGDYGFRLPELVLDDGRDEAARVRRGDVVGVLGYPGLGDDGLVYTTGIISSVRFGDLGGERLPLWYVTTAEMSPGNSGGLAVDRAGRFIGLPTAVRTEQATGGRLGMILALPFVLALLEQEDELRRAWADAPSAATGLTLDFRLEPSFGELRSAVGGGVHEVEVIGGGDVDVGYLGGDCVGYAAARPDFRWYGTAEGGRLHIGFRALEANADATLIVNAPDGSWHCNDDAFPGTLNPALSVDAMAGAYDIWVGSWAANSFIRGQLLLRPEGAGGLATGAPTLDLQGEPHFGTVALRAGFVPDPHAIGVTAGGSVNVGALALGPDCRGYAATRPDIRLVWRGASERLMILFVADNAGDDATLIVNGPDGQWHCNDDAHGRTLNPSLTFLRPEAGIYDLWVATYDADAWIPGELYITELPATVP
ncbi:MAG: serine protease [Geminicoccaceae bacterium]|nr:MAG: serine protease [Geminicoccaceae bacterium]